MRNDDIRGGDIEPPEKDEWEIKINMTELSLYSESGDLDELPPGSTRLIESVDYDSLRGRLLKASATLFRSRFRCPECQNRRELLAISPELHLSIISHLSLFDKRHLRLVNQKFNNFLIFEVPLEDLRSAREDKNIFLIEGARKGQLGFEPFIIRDVRKIHEDSGNTDATGDDFVQPSVRREKILLDIYYPLFMAEGKEYDDDDDVPEMDEWEIRIDMANLSLSSKRNLDELPPGSTRLVKSVDYELMRA
ncbi:hypothetical protein C8J57DRAFT_1728423 [Mycena rebaudengoi]|nr:hypothetical protein C8J57DRAFT_1728423 [Mycena rebaudengoi]